MLEDALVQGPIVMRWDRREGVSGGARPGMHTLDRNQEQQGTPGA